MWRRSTTSSGAMPFLMALRPIRRPCRRWSRTWSNSTSSPGRFRSKIGRTSVTYEFAAYRARDDLLMVTATQTLVLVDLDERKAVAIPDTYRDAIRSFEGDALES